MDKGDSNKRSKDNAIHNPFVSFETPRSPSRSTRSLNPPKLNEVNGIQSSPPRRRNNNTIFSDRYIPNRTGVDLQAAFSLTNEEILPDLRNNRNADNEIEIRREEEANRTFSTVLKAELFGDNVPMATANLSSATANTSLANNRSKTGRANTGIVNGAIASASAAAASTSSLSTTPPRSSTSGQNFPGSTGSSLPGNNNINGTNDSHNIISTNANNNISSDIDDITSTPRRKTNLFTYQSPKKSKPISRDLQQELYSLSPVRQDSQKLLLSPQKKPRTISKVPYRVLDAPELSDDFYLNLVDWGQQDVLAVGLGDSVYLWDGATQSVDRLCNLTNKDKVTSLNWIGTGTHLAIGTSKGLVEIWDATRIKCIRTMTGHSLRVSSLAWNEHILSSGSRDRTILNRDVRIEDHYVNKFDNHKQEVCGLKWNVEENKLASGGNDNNLFVWDGLNPKPLHQFTDHTAAVKAIAWSPHQRGILASGGGTADKTIKTWNTLTGNLVHDVNTGSQVCNLIWSKNSNELVSTHGYSRNQIIVWKYPSMQQIAQLTGHTYRVLYLSLSPDGETIVTGAGDETLRFWNVFEKNRHNESPASVLLGAFSQLR
ncbi:APC/C activator protein CDH1 homologue, putative [Candida dubliniensis CD36]|uniref:APC/C activator protein CDH1 homologue, putative n=1 Tax=Candida dubliniensis (strain CD36 / ATCC MYA-646 / CBS 7987 / NCPF 3949 / NRRL Y-17841) TaxID=573826 RepID=B9WAA1_CANDC|nr:APC/C activator protein CDH1 homologue, putative [Candida dubliniensis CD36]CAX43320.1 APC/C activator protein CDH1 homologue, putative [Candida dubliniensis CD36]